MPDPSYMKYYRKEADVFNQTVMTNTKTVNFKTKTKKGKDKDKDKDKILKRPNM